MRSSWIVLLLCCGVRLAQAEILAIATGDVVGTDNRSVEVGYSQSGTGLVSFPGDGRPAQFGGAPTSVRGFGMSRTGLPGTAYISLPPGAPAAYNADMAASFALGLGTDTSTDVTFAIYASYPFYQCQYVLHPVGGNRYSVRVYHHVTSTLLYESRELLGRRYCSSDTTLSCTTDADCPSDGTCTAPTSTAGYWAEIETRAVVAGSQIQCQLWIWGRQQHPEGWWTPGANVYGSHNVFIGLPFGETQVSVVIDDVVWARNMDRIGAGHVGILHPSANGAEATTYKRNGCEGTSGEYWKCVWPWRDGGYPTSTGAPGLRGEYPRQTQIALADPPVPLIGEIRAVQMWAMLFGGGSGGSWQWQVQPRVCPGSTCTLGPILDHTSGFGTLESGETLFVWRVDEQAPTAKWDVSSLQGYEVFARHLNRSGNNYFNVKAMAATYYVQRNPIPYESNLRDHDIGPNDGQITVAMVGDSLAGATVAVTCDNDSDRPCSQDTYCSWDAPDGQMHYGDRPMGGCVSDAQCQTCVGRREAFNAGAGVPCTSNAECPQTGGTCNTTEGVCTQNEQVPCTTDADCNGFGGACDTTATCQDACPGGSCPVTAKNGSWADSLCRVLDADNCFVCGLGGETVYMMIQNRWDKIVTDPVTDSQCKPEWIVRGSHAQPDYVVVYEGANDLATFGMATADCQGVFGVYQSYNTLNTCQHTLCICENHAPDATKDYACLTDAECQSVVGPSSRCVGATKTNQTATRGAMCFTAAPLGRWPDCSMHNGLTGGCSASIACPNSMTCIDTVGDSQPGFCQCTTDAQCPSGFRCAGARCRRECATDATCVESGRSGACVDRGDGVTVCKGRCTLSYDVRTCSTDADCDFGVVAQRSETFGPRWHAKGICANGRCAQGGTDWCGHSGSYPHAYKRTIDHMKPVQFARMLKWMHDDLTQRQDSDPPDGLPILIYVQPPDYPLQDMACEIGQVYHDEGYIRLGAIMAKRAGVRVVEGLREVFSPYYQTNRSGLLHTDWIHNTALGGAVIAQHVKKYLARLNACRVTGTDAAQGYCYSLSTRQYESTTCDQDADCTNPATVCRSRKCTSEADCPGSGDYCAAE